MPEVVHGSASAYESGNCRCSACRSAAMAARREARERRRAMIAAGDTSRIRHGTWAAYATDGCRCPTCRAFKAAYQKEYRSRRKQDA